MEKSYDVADSSDWLSTPLAPLSAVESGLRCQVCKDFYNTPMMTSCSHTFCSLCIRRCLTSDGKCPSCRTPDQELRLRRNWAIEELVTAFQAARPSILKLGEEVKRIEAGGIIVGGHGRKRKLDDTELETRDGGSDRITRSRSKRSPTITQDMGGDAQADKTTGQRNSARGQNELKSVVPWPDSTTEENLSACPICGEEMKLEEVFPHLDIHQDGESSKSPRKPAHSNLNSFGKDPTRTPTPPKPQDRLPALSYSILNENALRKKIGTLGIPTTGSKQMLIRRHQEWVNLWNANCDSSHPRSKKDLLHDLVIWEKSQNQVNNVGNQSGGGSAVMRKDFDGAAWAASHSDDFQQLIAQARRKVKRPEQTSGEETTTNGPGPTSEESRPLNAKADEGAPVMSNLPQRTCIELDIDDTEPTRSASNGVPYR